MDDFLKIKLDKLSEDDRTKAIKYLLGIKDSEKIKRQEEIELSLMSDYTEEAIELNKKWGKMQGLSTGYKSLDIMTLGLVPGELTVVAGKTSYGKTTLAINIANQIALHGTPVLFVTLEMTKKEITSRYMNINGGLTDNYYKVAAVTVFQIKNRLSWKSIAPLIYTAKDSMGVGLVVIDHLHYFTRELDKLSEDLGRITMELKTAAIEKDIPIMLISHVRRTNDEATIDDLRGSSYIGQDADIVLMVGRDKDIPNKLFVQIQKNRNRGFDYNNDKAELDIDGIKITDATSIEYKNWYEDIPKGW
jgi:replicative DNA helicase